MRAHAGDWLIIERGDVEHHARRGRIEEVRSADGAPPYVVRWLDTDHTVLVFPGPDAHVLTPEELARADAAAANRFAVVQHEIRGHAGKAPEASAVDSGEGPEENGTRHPGRPLPVEVF